MSERMDEHQKIRELVSLAAAGSAGAARRADRDAARSRMRELRGGTGNVGHDRVGVAKIADAAAEAERGGAGASAGADSAGGGIRAPLESHGDCEPGDFCVGAHGDELAGVQAGDRRPGGISSTQIFITCGLRLWDTARRRGLRAVQRQRC